MQTIFRDDDLGEYVNPKKTDLFIKVHEIFNKNSRVHHIGLITRNLNRQTQLKQYILQQKNISIQLHCVEHLDFTQMSDVEIHNQFAVGIKTIQDNFNITPTMWFPPWQKTNEEINRIANESYNLRAYTTGMNLADYAFKSDRFNKISRISTDGKVFVNFHYWDTPDISAHLELALLKYKT